MEDSLDKTFSYTTTILLKFYKIFEYKRESSGILNI